jgi:uncharacterized protein
MTKTGSRAADSTLKVKVVPGSSTNGIAGWLGDRLKIRVTAKAEKGKANDAVIALLAKILGIPKRDLSIRSGRDSAQKIIEISGLTSTEMRSRLPAQGGGGR